MKDIPSLLFRTRNAQLIHNLPHPFVTPDWAAPSIPSIPNIRCFQFCLIVLHDLWPWQGQWHFPRSRASAKFCRLVPSHHLTMQQTGGGGAGSACNPPPDPNHPQKRGGKQKARVKSEGGVSASGHRGW